MSTTGDRAKTVAPEQLTADPLIVDEVEQAMDGVEASPAEQEVKRVAAAHNWPVHEDEKRPAN